MKFGYIRVSTREQNTDRQEIALREWGIDEKYIYAVYDLWKSRSISLTSAARQLGVSHQTFERWVREQNEEKENAAKRRQNPQF